MKRHILISALLLISFALQANNQLHTTYKRGTFTTVKTASVDADFNTCSKAIDDFIYEFQTDPELLFSWALKKTGQTHNGDGSDDVILVMNRVTYDPEAMKSTINADFIMPNGFSIRNKDLMSYVHDNRADNTREITVDFYYSGSLLKKGKGVFLLTKIDDTHTDIKLTIDIKFGWFFNIFITKKRYKDVMEWRIGQFIDNIKEESQWRFEGDPRQHVRKVKSER